MLYFDKLYVKRTLAKLNADHAQLAENANELLMFVAHLEHVERTIERRTPLATAIRRL